MTDLEPARSKMVPVANRNLGLIFAAILTGIVAILAASIPQILALKSLQPGELYTFAVWNVSDAGVYASWADQYRAGALFHQNFFCTDVPPYHLFSPFFALVGKFAALTNMSTVQSLEVARIVGMIALLALVWKLIGKSLAEPASKWTAFATVCFGSGLTGVLIKLHQVERFGLGIDHLQPESNTFFSMLVSPLFLFSTSLYILTVLLFQKFCTSGKPIGSVAIFVAASALTVTHTYEIITLTAVVAFIAQQNRTNLRIAPVAAYISAVGASALYVVWALRDGQINQLRDLQPTPNFPIIQVLIGFGWLLPLAAFGYLRGVKQADPEHFRLLGFWILITFLATLLPLNFQRKLLMPVHVPMAILAGYGIYHLATSKHRFATIPAIAVIAITTLLSPYFLLKAQMEALQGEKRSETVIPSADVAVLESAEAKRYRTIQVLPDTEKDKDDQPVSIYSSYFFSPYLLARPVYSAHWCETKNAKEKETWLGQLAQGRLSVREIQNRLKQKPFDALFVGVDSGDSQTRPNCERLLRDAGFKLVFAQGDAKLYATP